jgi:hypothetical protein
MTDLHNRLARIAGPTAAPTSEVVDADLDRGRRALQRRRTAQATAGSALAVVAIVAAVSFTTATGAPSGGDIPPGAGGPAPASASAETESRPRLIPYTGKQPKAFTIGTIPDGWFIQASDDYSVVIAPDEAKDGGPDVNPSTNPLHNPHDFSHKITVMLQSRDQNGAPEGTRVKVGGRDGVLVKSPPAETPDGALPTPADGDTGWTLWVEQPTDVHLLVQFWEGLGFSQDEMVQIGAGVRVGKTAKQGAG